MTDKPDISAMFGLMHTLLDYWRHSESRPALEKKRAAQQKQINLAGTLRTVLGIFNWQYILLPVGSRVVYRSVWTGDYINIVRARELYIFGVRIARWVVDDKLYYEPLNVPPVRRERIAERKRKRFRSYKRGA